MTPLLVYLAKVVICSGILYAYYHAVLRNNRFHQWNRYYLLLSAILSLVVPLLRIPMPFMATETEGIYVYTSQVVTLRENMLAPSETSLLSTVNWSTVLYSFVLLLLLMRLAVGYIKIYSLIRHSHVEFLKPYWMVLSEKVASPFSFFRYIFWNNSLNAETPEGQQILRHEMVHVQEKHSWDKLFMEVVTALCWINPFFHLIKRELSVIHEFIADRKAVQNGDVAAYAHSILQMALQSQHSFGITNNFSHQPIKRRILMLTQSNKLRFSYLRRVLILPLAVFIFCSLAFVANENNQPEADPAFVIAENVVTPNRKLIPLHTEQISATLPAPSAKTTTDKNTTGNNPKERLEIATREKNNPKKDTTNPLSEVVVTGNGRKPPPPPAPAATATVIAFAQDQEGGLQEIFTFVEQPPTFPGGEPALTKYLSSHIRYPHQATERNIQGTVFVSFVVKADGSLTGIKTIGAPKGGGLEEEAIRVVTAMPKWTPGKQNGRLVNVQFNLPIRFVLQESSPKSTGAIVGKNGVYARAEEMPEFPGGRSALARYLTNNLRYPETARKAKIQGTVQVSFIVREDGSLKDITALGQAVGGGLEEEALRVVKSMPKWKPAKEDGKNVPLVLNIPIAFRLQ